MPEHQITPAKPGNRFDFIKRGRTAMACLSAAALFLTGCAQLPPMIPQLKAEKNTRIILVAEKSRFEYTVPASVDAVGGGVPLVALIGALTAVVAQKGLENANAKLLVAASEKRLTSNHREAFVDELVRRFKAIGLDAEVLYVPYASATIGGDDRRFYRPVFDGITLPAGVPVFSLNLDVGSCTFGGASPCIRYALIEVLTLPDGKVFKPANTPPPGVNGTIVGAGIPEAKAAVRPFKYRAVVGTTPNYGTKPTPQPKTFASIDDAVARIEEFDGELAKLVPASVDQLIGSGETLPVRP
ncbi:hypothetical protein SAMN05216350_112114 [Polaromonas sp. YR568]|uniref:hypothetical protein n=1 Tax=Polaromonas sp. YR568 TaxID=1855301 RepID=UPI0008E8752B|nr:hypothetical protein [Polaromonas sp. YR568]SFV01169.1 hypothetical protein SAMN05216350_112114 [Polaromonas sp. YR568]